MNQKLDIKVTELKCNLLVNPLGVETPKPKLSWVIETDGYGVFQTSYRIIVVSSLALLNEGKGDIWDTGEVESDQSIHIVYNGTDLTSAKRCWWKVWVKCNHNDGVWSEPSFWEMGLIDKSDWKAKWIAGSSKEEHSPYIRKSFEISKSIKSARAYVCGIGYHEFYINGDKVGDAVLEPAFTQYDKRVLYVTHDITQQLSIGTNSIGIILGNGWYNSFPECVWFFKYAPWRHIPKLLVQINIEFEDGDKTEIISDNTWTAEDSPIFFNAVRNGEFYDSRLEKDGWSTPEYDDSNWRRANITKAPGGILTSQQMPPIKVMKEIKPISLKEIEPNVWVYDFGQNMAGWVKLKITGEAGTEIVLKYSERVNEQGDIDVAEIERYVKTGEFQTDKYILSGKGEECWQPRFTYHGFRYVKVIGFPGLPTLDSLTACFVHTALEKRGNFECSNELLNKIQTATIWSSLSNYHGFPTDCPQREKNGWTGDALLSAEQLLLNFDPATAYRKWMQDFRDVQRSSGQLPGIVPTGGWGFNWGSGPAWDSAFILIPWYVYEYTGDMSLLEDNYDNMKSYVEYMRTMSVDNIVSFGLGDWLPPQGNKNIKCPTPVTDTAYYYVDTLIVSKVAELLGLSDDIKEYGELADNIKKAFRERFVDINNSTIAGDCQTSLACGIYQGLIEQEELPSFVSRMVEEVEKADNHIDCGILGTKYIMHALTNNGRADKAYAMATQTTFPGWGYWIQNGATTLYEDWEGVSSLNHHMFGDISAWFYKGLAGINQDTNSIGFKNIIINPNIVGDLKWVRASYQSPYGLIKVSWEKEDDNQLKLNVSIPVNCTAEINVLSNNPDGIKENGQLILDNRYIDVKASSEKIVKLKIASGKYSFVILV